MVDIRIVIEGGIVPHINDSAATINNSEKLRESFHKLFSQIINPESFNLIIEMKGGFEQAIMSFKEYSKLDQKTSILIDLDGVSSSKQDKIVDLKIENLAERVFFMIQEMEAWILSQPESIEKAYKNRYNRQRVKINLEQEIRKLYRDHPEEILEPSVKLKVLLGRYYVEMKGNRKKDKKYGKLKDAPMLIENLDINKLIRTFDDVNSLINHIQRYSTEPNTG